VVTERDERDYGEGSPSDAGDRLASPAMWPRDPRERAQPRSRLRQALSVARRHSEPSDAWGTAPTQRSDERREPLPEPAQDAVGEAATFQHVFADLLGPPAGERESIVPGPSAGVQPVPTEALREADRIMREESLDAAHAEAPTVSTEDPVPFQEVRPMIESPSQVVVDLRDSTEAAESQLVAADSAAHYGLGRSWGRSWRDSAQGWVATPAGEPIWRPVVSTTPELATWDVDTYLGVVTAEVAVEAGAGDYRQMGATLARGREIGVEGLVEEAIERGAHAVIGVTMQYTPLGERLLLTLSGTAVTLREKQR
jgi:uncharacterized protein YbjQ (UPF0145 family)